MNLRYYLLISYYGGCWFCLFLPSPNLESFYFISVLGYLYTSQHYPRPPKFGLSNLRKYLLTLYILNQIETLPFPSVLSDSISQPVSFTFILSEWIVFTFHSITLIKSCIIWLFWKTSEQCSYYYICAALGTGKLSHVLLLFFSYSLRIALCDSKNLSSIKFK